MDITAKLNLNKFPKDCDNLSFVDAKNIKLAKNDTSIVNDDFVFLNENINNYLKTYYNGKTFVILNIFSCINEIIIFAKLATENKISIFRYDEIHNLTLAYGNPYKLSFNNGKFKCAFTYNVDNSLIIAISEYDTTNKDIPLRIINLGNIDDNTIENDKNTPENKLSCVPEVYIPTLANFDYIKGNIFKGWYYLFIRYKINKNDYTQWYPFGIPIYIDNINTKSIIKYGYGQNWNLEEGQKTEIQNILFGSQNKYGYVVGCSDNFSNKEDIVNKSFNLNINFNKNNTYNIIQLGFVCITKSYTKCYKSFDIKINNNKLVYNLDLKNTEEYSINEIIKTNYNYFNVKNLINYNNRLYISNYKEQKIKDNIKDLIKNITITRNGYYNNCGNWLSRSIYFVNADVDITSGKAIQFYDNFNDELRIYLYQYLNIDKETRLQITYNDGSGSNTIAGVGYMFTIGSKNGKPQNNISIISIYHGDSGITITGEITIKIFDDNSLSFIDTKLNLDKIYVDYAGHYINTKLSFNNRSKNTTLIPGEVYNFFIHFVDKYGTFTDGYRLDNTRYYDEQGNERVVVSYINYLVGSGFYVAPKINSKVIKEVNDNGNIGYEINIESSDLFDTISNNNILSTTKDYNNYLFTVEEYYRKYLKEQYKTLYWHNITTHINKNKFISHYNTKGDCLFKIPFEEYDFINNNNTNIKELNVWKNEYTINNININNITIPEGYIGFFISYEKFESISRGTGLLTRSDFKSQDKIVNVIQNVANRNQTNTSYFYSDVFDINDSIKLDINAIRIEQTCTLDNYTIKSNDVVEYNQKFKYQYIENPVNYNKPIISTAITNKYNIYAINNYNLKVANSSSDNRIGLSTALELDVENLFKYIKDKNENYITLYKATLLNISKDLYINENKTLIKLSDIIYKNPNDEINKKYSITINKGFNGVCTFNNFLVYNDNGLIVDETTYKAYRLDNTLYYPWESDYTYNSDRPFAAYIQLPIYDTYFHESKIFNNEPKSAAYLTNNATEKDKGIFNIGCIVIPQNSIDLFKNPQTSVDELYPKTYTNFREDLINITDFNKTIRRSNIIQDESRINSWRTFEVENYKNITENKGIITNIVGIGTTFIAHTEFSMFIFDGNNMMQTNNKDIQLLQQDTFDIQYKELLTDKLGIGGLQDNESFIVGQFGYIYFNNNFNRICRFDNGKFSFIDNDIINYLYNNKFTKLRFIDDVVNNRILISCIKKLSSSANEYITLSYNYHVNNFISFHDYIFDYGITIKDKIYYIKSGGNTKIYNLINSNDAKGINDTFNTVDIIINTNYDKIKFLESIIYKFINYIKTGDIIEADNNYSGHEIRVYNNNCDTKQLNIYVNPETKNDINNYKKPYWYLGNWNFNYLRNAKNNITLSNEYSSRIYGNYFIISIKFKNDNYNIIELESLDYKTIN